MSKSWLSLLAPGSHEEAEIKDCKYVKRVLLKDIVSGWVLWRVIIPIDMENAIRFLWASVLGTEWLKNPSYAIQLCNPLSEHDITHIIQMVSGKNDLDLFLCRVWFHLHIELKTKLGNLYKKAKIILTESPEEDEALEIVNSEWVVWKVDQVLSKDLELINGHFSFHAFVEARNHFTIKAEHAKVLIWEDDYDENKDYYIIVPELNSDEKEELRKHCNAKWKISIFAEFSEKDGWIKLRIWNSGKWCSWVTDIQNKKKKNKKKK